MKKILSAIAVTASLATVAPAMALDEINWDMQSTYPGSLTQLGTLGKVLSERLTAVSGGSINLKFQEPGAIVPALETFDAVASGAVQAGWSTPGYWTGKDTALALFAAVPFGPRASEYIAWMKFGGGQDLLDEVYGAYGIKSLACGVIAPEASGWVHNEINSVDDLKGLKMRFFGLGAKVMQKLGVSTQLLAGGDIFPALELGTIDATEFSMPAIDLKLGFYQVAKYYYFPGWHQQSTIFELMLNKDEWDALDDQTKAVFETSVRMTLGISCMFMWIILAALAFGAVFDGLGAVNAIDSLFTEKMGLSPWMILILMQLSFIVMGTFLDDTAMLVIVAPLYVPLVGALGFDLIWYGVLYTITTQIAYMTPPFGYNLFLMRAMAPPEITLRDIYRSILPFVLVMVVALALVMAFPQIALWLPQLVYG